MAEQMRALSYPGEKILAAAEHLNAFKGALTPKDVNCMMSPPSRPFIRNKNRGSCP
jgi:hypothetical protein